MKPTDINISGGNSQILPNATHSIQFFVGDDFVRKTHESSALEGEIMDMCYFSATMPDDVPFEIIRKNYLDYCESKLEECNVLCVTGEDGVGVTTFLSQFVKKHANNCVSYFNNGLQIVRLNSEVVEGNIYEQLYWFAFDKTVAFENLGLISSLSTFVLRKMKQTNQKLYFVFDGFDDIPSEKLDGLKRLFTNMLWDKGRFIFSGAKEKIRLLLPKKLHLDVSQLEIMRFGEAEVKEYFRQATHGELSEDDSKMLYDLTRGNAHRMEQFRSKYIDKGMLDKLRTSNLTGQDNIYDQDFQMLFGGDDVFVKRLFTLLSYAEFPLSVSLASKILQCNESDLRNIAKDKYFDYITLSDKDILSLQSESFHKYLRSRLLSFKQEIELRIIDVLENDENPLAYCYYLPAIYKSVNQIDKLINYLNTGNLQQIMVNKRSQAALNEQCDYGYDACYDNIDKYTGNIFRFAINKSASREIEKNELWDNEIEALLSVGQYEQALALAQSIYLQEERLKSFLLIARKKSLLSSADYAVLRDNISQLVDTIDFENIPDKAVELAKLLMPIDIEAATEIIDRIAKKHKDIAVIDKLYAILSMAYSKDNEGNVTNFDLVSSKIQDENLRTVTHTARHLFDDMDVSQFLDEVSKLTNNSQKLYFLQFWLPDHEDKADIGKVVLEGIRLIVAESDSEIPRAKVLNNICKSMRKMNREELEQAIVFLDAMGDSIKYPTFDFVDVELTIIEALKDMMPDKSKSMLEALYFYVLDLKDDSIRMTCLSKLLGKYENLGNKKELEQIIDSTVDIRKHISEGIETLLHETAYHLKVIEEPIKALVCNYPTMIDEMIGEVNTDARKSRAYSLAAREYLLQQDEDKIDLDYFFQLLSNTEDINSDRLTPIILMSEMLASAEKLNSSALLPSIKAHFYFVENIESAKNRSIICMRIYLWFKKNFPEDTFASKVKRFLLQTWNSIDVVWYKIEIGFFMAKNFAKVSKEEACEMIDKCRKIKETCFLASSSCVDAYNESIRLYALSIGNLIKLGLCDDKILHDFSDDIDGLLSNSERAIMWGNIALEYYLVDKVKMFTTLGDKYFPVDYSSFSLLDQKTIIFSISPALFLRSQTKFFTLLQGYDETFRNECILYVCNFIFVKQTNFLDMNPEHKAYELSYTDYTNLLDLLENSSDDENFSSVIDSICKSLRITNQKIDLLSSDQKKTVIGHAERIVNAKLPTKRGIRHDGYKVACLAALSSLCKEFKTKDAKVWQAQIEGIANKADQAFLYFLLAPYFTKRSDQQRYFEKGISISESINATFDKVRRLDMSISECIDYNLGTLIPDVAKSAMRSLANNGTLEDHKRLVDMAYQYNPELADQLVNMLDQDPARVRYKRKLERHIASVKKLDQAKKEMTSIDGLNRYEQKKFFETQLANLVEGKGQLYDVNKIFHLSINHIYHNSITDAHAAIIYLMETVTKKHQQSKNQKELLLNIHTSLKYNLKLVLSLASGTKARLEKIENLIQDHNITPSGVIGIGERCKALEFLTDWYSQIGMNELIVIDPYFSPSDLSLIRQLTDINTNLSIKILTHVSKYKIDEYQIMWHQLSAGIKVPIQLNFVYFTDKPEDGPLHDRYWICSDNEHGKYVGIKPNSISGLGKKECSITPVDAGMIPGILYNSYVQYVHIKIPKKDNRELAYDKILLK